MRNKGKEAVTTRVVKYYGHAEILPPRPSLQLSPMRFVRDFQQLYFRLLSAYLRFKKRFIYFFKKRAKLRGKN